MSKNVDNDDAMEKGRAGTFHIYADDHLQQVSPTSTEKTMVNLPQQLDNSIGSPTTQLSPKSTFWTGRWLQRDFWKRPQQNVENIKRSTIVRSFNECPTGYPRLAAFLDSDENFMLYRRFGFLQARALLYKQDELRELEDKLDKMDQRDAKTKPKVLKSRDKDDANGERKNLIGLITKEFKEYAELLKTARELAGFSRASARDYESVNNYFNNTAPLCNEESYILRKEDIITLKPGREDSWLDAIVESLLQRFSFPIVRRWFCSKELLRKTDPDEAKVVLYSRERINLVVSVLITSMIVGLLVIPVYILWKLARTEEFTNRTTATIIGVLLACTLVFSGVLSLFTRAKRHEILAAAAGYCAVLVVFIGNIGEISPK